MSYERFYVGSNGLDWIVYDADDTGDSPPTYWGSNRIGAYHHCRELRAMFPVSQPGDMLLDEI